MFHLPLPNDMVEVHQLHQQNVVELVEVLGGVGGARPLGMFST